MFCAHKQAHKRSAGRLGWWRHLVGEFEGRGPEQREEVPGRHFPHAGPTLLRSVARGCNQRWRNNAGLKPCVSAQRGSNEQQIIIIIIIN